MFFLCLMLILQNTIGGSAQVSSSWDNFLMNTSHMVDPVPMVYPMPMAYPALMVDLIPMVVSIHSSGGTLNG